MGEKIMKGREIYHICTDGLSRNILFKSDTDYIKAINDIAVCTFAKCLSMYCFCLMDNHVHFIAGGSYDACLAFIRMFKRRVNLRAKCFSADISIKRIDNPEYLRTAIAYVIRNPVAANIQVAPGEYRWSSGNLYFSDRSKSMAGTRNISSLGYDEMRALVNSHVKLPGKYAVACNGMILPGNYVEHVFVENLYGNVRRYLYYLSKNDDLEMEEMSTDMLRKVKYEDKELYNSMTDICFKEFGKNSVEELSIEGRLKMAMKLKKKYGVGLKQAARVVGLDPELLRGHF
ncbi:hypothetical protein B5F83_09760 [Muribaculum sp. An289]|nr:hypothetical protein B5F83_09760 [Muribaculum sp. An289]OUO40727.1 hypothetical protein B5F81_09870 [Muribaculum sp. An287]